MGGGEAVQRLPSDQYPSGEPIRKQFLHLQTGTGLFQKLLIRTLGLPPLSLGEARPL